MTRRLPGKFLLACRRNGIRPTRFVLVVSVARQRVMVFERANLVQHDQSFLPLPARDERGEGRGEGQSNERRLLSPALSSLLRREEREKNRRQVYQATRTFVASTARFGTGQLANSNCTPLGLHRIARKVGGGWPVGTVFESRKNVGLTWCGRPDAAIAHRILWLEGLEPGLNRGGNVDSLARYIYIHGLGDELTLGRPASRGCIHLAASDLMPLYERVPEGTLVWIGED